MSKYLEDIIYMTAKEICKYGEEKNDFFPIYRGMINFLHHADFMYCKLKHVSGKANALAQEAFLEKYQELKETKDPEDRTCFVDGVHTFHNFSRTVG